MTGVAQSPAHFPFPCVVADVGGTKARFAVLPAQDAALQDSVVLETARAASFPDLFHKALLRLGEARPRSLIIAAAGAVQGRAVTLTNALQGGEPVHVVGPELLQALELEQGLLLNDFEGLCLALPFLTNDQVIHLGGAAGEPQGPRVAVGPGTGFGVAALLNVGGRYLPVQSEAGHMSFGDWTLPEATQCIEDVLSGRGLAQLHASLAGLAQPWEPAAVGEAALAGTNAEATQAVQMFLGVLARFAGDMALTFCATGGVFIGGGIVPKLAPLIEVAALRAQFENKGSHAAYMRAMPTFLIRDPLATLHGLAAAAMRPEAFLLDYASRLWRAV
jgi:glucokinase